MTRMAHSVVPPKPAGQGTVAPAYVQPPGVHFPGVSSTFGSPTADASGGWEEHEHLSNPGGFGGSR